MVWNLTLTLRILPKGPINSPKGPKRKKKPLLGPHSKLEDRTVFPKPKVKVYISRSKKIFFTLPQPKKIATKGPKSAKKTPNLADSKTEI